MLAYVQAPRGAVASARKGWCSLIIAPAILATMCCAASPVPVAVVDRACITEFVPVSGDSWPHGAFGNWQKDLLWLSCEGKGHCQLWRLDRAGKTVIGEFAFDTEAYPFLSNLAVSEKGTVYVAAGGSNRGLVMRRRDGEETAKVIWEGRLGEWPRVEIDGKDIVIGDRSRIHLLAEGGEVLNEVAVGYHTAACVRGGEWFGNVGKAVVGVSLRGEQDQAVLGNDPEWPVLQLACSASAVIVLGQNAKRSAIWQQNDDHCCDRLLLPWTKYWRIAASKSRIVLWSPQSDVVLVAAPDDLARMTQCELSKDVRLRHALVVGDTVAYAISNEGVWLLHAEVAQ